MASGRQGHVCVVKDRRGYDAESGRKAPAGGSTTIQPLLAAVNQETGDRSESVPRDSADAWASALMLSPRGRADRHSPRPRPLTI